MCHSLNRPVGARKQRGFTLLELLVVLLIIAMLAGYVGPRLFVEVDKAKIKTASSQMKSLADALDHYRLDVGQYPSAEHGLEALTNRPADADAQWQGPYLNKAVPDDPWGRDYVYQVPGTQEREFDLMSHGADGKPGGSGMNADIVW
ncbi:type II secretion system major pseudopilin GspG [Pararobbsia alpina]|uniref:Type II secretion system core protein G n=1 Tax=Pararobbsia alpina TaxID=621374 RepID=A0A6S7AUS9_9BURK|nr:type II secretion system major pseudopilin GspG [Pararobbsia alpina]CAB3776279.1 Type II secretion system protein G [Pararobbsia alpina]